MPIQDLAVGHKSTRTAFDLTFPLAAPRETLRFGGVPQTDTTGGRELRFPTSTPTAAGSGLSGFLSSLSFGTPVGPSAPVASTSYYPDAILRGAGHTSGTFVGQSVPGSVDGSAPYSSALKGLTGAILQGIGARGDGGNDTPQIIRASVPGGGGGPNMLPVLLGVAGIAAVYLMVKK